MVSWISAAQANGDSYYPDDKERKLEQIIEQMQEKMDALEAEVNELKGEEEPYPLLEKRVEEIEKDNAYWFQPNSFRAYWKGRPRFETRDKEFQIQMIGRIMNDWTWQDPNKPLENAFEKKDIKKIIKNWKNLLFIF